MSDKQLYIGLISGTSIDSIDCALVDCSGKLPELVSSLGGTIDKQLRNDLLGICRGEDISLALLGKADKQLGLLFGETCNRLLDHADVNWGDIQAIGSHGQTVWHQASGDFPFSMQLGDPSQIAHTTGIPVVADFRQKDMSAGGQGAPLAPLLHREFFASENENRAVVNIGGMSNVTLLPARGEPSAWDTGPGNVLLDYWVEKHRGVPFDDAGHWARSGTPDDRLLADLLTEPYLSQPGPKSTGRELFNGNWLETKLAAIPSGITPQDVQATLVEYTACTIADSINNASMVEAAYLCGGGTHNTYLAERLAALLPNKRVASTRELGLDPDWVEAVTFGWLAMKTLKGEAVDTTPFTGAKQPVVLGGIYPSS